MPFVKIYGRPTGRPWIPSEFLIKINYTFASFFITLFFTLCGLLPATFGESVACHPKRSAKVWLATQSLGEGWWVVLDSNQRPLRCQRNALTNWANHPKIAQIISNKIQIAILNYGIYNIFRGRCSAAGIHNPLASARRDEKNSNPRLEGLWIYWIKVAILANCCEPPTTWIFSVVLFLTMGDKMTIGSEIEQIRQECNMPLFIAYSIFDTDENGYHQIVIGRQKPTVFQLIMFIDSTHRPMKSLE